MRGRGRIALTAAGLLAFLVLWQVVVLATRPDPILRVGVGLGPLQGEAVPAVVLDEDGRVRARRSLAPPHGPATLAGWIRSYAVTVAGVAFPGPDVERLLQEAREISGAGLDARDVRDAPDALAAARAVQALTRTRPTWLPGPVEAVRALVEMLGTGEMARHVVASVFRVACGFTLAVYLGIPLGLALGSFARLNAFADGVLQTLRPISPIAWLPAATLVLGGGDVAAIFLIFLASFFPIVVSTAAAVGAVDLRYRRSAENFGVHGLAMARSVILPAAFPSILTGLRVAIGVSWVVVVAAEMLGVESGLGFLVLDARNQLRYDRVVAAMIVIGLIGLSIDTVVRRLERRELVRRGRAVA